MDKNWLFAPVWFFFTICIECVVAWLIFYFWITIKLSYFRSSCRFLIGSHSEVKTPLFHYINLVKIVAGMTSLMSSPFSAMSPFCAAQSYAPLTAKWSSSPNHQPDDDLNKKCDWRLERTTASTNPKKKKKS